MDVPTSADRRRKAEHALLLLHHGTAGRGVPFILFGMLLRSWLLQNPLRGARSVEAPHESEGGLRSLSLGEPVRPSHAKVTLHGSGAAAQRLPLRASADQEALRVS